MRAYCNQTRVIALHADDQMLDPSVYGEGVDVVIVPNDFVFAKLGDHGDLARPQEADIPPPRTATPLQMRRALRAAGLLDRVETFIGTQSAEVKEAWEYAVSIERDDPVLVAAASALKLNRKAVDDLFRAAAQMRAA